METFQIREAVTRQVELWTIRQSRPWEGRVSISERAVSFLVEVIENIEKDRSDIWRNDPFYPGDADNQQIRAIELVPVALDTLSIKLGRLRDGQNVVITTWEIWHELSLILDRLCFIPKDI